MTDIEIKVITKKECKKKPLCVDEALSLVGDFGRFQLCLTLLLVLMILPSCFQVFIMYFSTISPRWRCREETLPNSTCNPNVTDTISNSKVHCDMLEGDWEFIEASYFSLVVQFNLVCHRAWIVELLSSAFFFGWAFGAVCSGWMADNYGRKIVLMPCYITVILVGFISSFLTNIYLIVACRVIIGIAFSGTYPQMYVLLSETVGVKYRAIASLFFWLAIPISYCVGALFAMACDNWKLLSILSTAPFVFVIAFYKVLPESFVWLQMQGKIDLVRENLATIGKWNKRPFPDDATIVPPSVSNTKHSSSPLDLFRSRALALSTTVQFSSWTIVGLVYYGLQLEAKDLGGSIYTNYVLLSIVDAPSIIIGMLIAHFIGRKKAVLPAMAFGSVACLAIAFVPKSIKLGRVTLGLVGKFLVSLSFYSMYTWSVELFPVYVRAEAMGLMQIASKMGAAIAPWIAKSLLQVSEMAPYLVMGIAGIVSTLTQLYLPETIYNTCATITPLDKERKNDEKMSVVC